jgi:hypothetical protein
MDPRVTASTGDLDKLFSSETQMATTLSAVSKAALQAHAAKEQLSKAGAGALAPEVHRFDAALNSLLDGTGADASKPRQGLDRLAEQAIALYLQLGQADAAPTVAQQQAVEQIGQQGSDAVQQWEQFKKSDIPAMNERLRIALLPSINLDRQPEDVPGGGDED